MGAWSERCSAPRGRASDIGGTRRLGGCPPGGATADRLLTVSELLFSEMLGVYCREGNAVKGHVSWAQRTPGKRGIRCSPF